MKNVQKPEKIHLDKLIDEIRKGKFVIPDFQRDFEWGPWDVRDLIKSIFMDYYIGTLLLWEGNKQNFDVLSCKPIYGFTGKNNPDYIVLDGQQRLTAIHYAFFQPEKKFPYRKSPYLFFLNINELLEENYEEAFFYYNKTKYYSRLIENREMQFESHIFPLGVMQGGSWEIGDWIKEYRDFWQNKLEHYENEYAKTEEPPSKEQVQIYIDNAKELKDLMDDLLKSYNISYIELDSDIEVGKVCDIFTHINSKGIRLDIFDLLNAILRPKEIKLKELWEKASAKLDFTDSKKMKVHVLQVMSILSQSYCSAKYLYYLVPDAIKTIKKEDGSKEQIVLVGDKQEFTNKWHEAVSAIERTIKVLKNPRDFGAIKPEFVPYPSIIPALSAIKKYVENSNLSNKVDVNGKIRQWYWASVFLNRYSSSVESTSAKDFMDLKKWFDDDDKEPDLIVEFLSSYKSIDLQRENQKGSAIYKAIFNLFILNEARDWETFDLPEYEALDDHHIVPHSWGKEHIGNDINSILNRTAISTDTNRKVIHSQLPNVYLKRMLENNSEEKVYKVLESHLVSRKAVEILLRYPFTKEDYYEFIKERKNSIIQAVEDIIINEKVDLPVNLQELNDRIEKVEFSIRKQIAKELQNGKDDIFKTFIPSHIQQKVNDRITRELKKNPSLSEEDFEDFSRKLEYFDLQEYFQTISNKTIWSKFKGTFQNKENLSIKFNQLSNLRNAIRHSRSADNVTKMEGEAAILWFESILKKNAQQLT